MEGMKFYAVLAPISSAANENERKTIMICNAAAVSVAKCLNKYNPGFLTWQDFEDAVLDAQVAALTHIDCTANGSLSYAEACGRSSAIRKCKSVTRKNNLFSPLEYCGEDGEWSTNSKAASSLDEASADSSISFREEAELKVLKETLVRLCFNQLSTTDREIIILKEKKTPYKDIAESFGCNAGTIQKRVYDIAKRFDRILSQNGYYRLG